MVRSTRKGSSQFALARLFDTLLFQSNQMGLSSQNLPHTTVRWSMCSTQKELFPVHTMKSYLPIEFRLMSPTCKRNLIGWYSNLYSDKRLKPTKKQTQQNTSCEDLTEYFSFAALCLCWSTISGWRYPLDFQFLPGAPKSSQLFTSQTTFHVFSM